MKTIKEKGNMNMYESCKVKEAMYNRLADMMKTLEDEIKSQAEYQTEKQTEIAKKLEEDETYKDSYNYTWDVQYVQESVFKEKACKMILQLLEDGAENA